MEEAKDAVKEQPEAQAAEGAVAEVKQEGPQRSPREIFIERIRAARPEAKYDEDEEEVYRQAGGYMDDLGGRAKAYDDMQEKFKTRFNANPDEAGALLDYLDGTPLVAALRKNLGDEALAIKEGDEGWDEYKRAGDARKKDLEEAAARLEEFRKNDEESTKTFGDFVKEAGMDDVAADKFQQVVASIVNDMAAGKISKDTLTLLKHAVDYDNDIAGAREQGKVDGRNEKIEVEKKRMQGSGLPNATAGGEAEVDAPKTEANSTAEWLGRFRKS